MKLPIKPFLFVLGSLSLVLGIIGIFVPLLPTTPFVLLSAWCFLNSSERAHTWLVQQPVLGKMIRDWQEHRAISTRSKLIALIMIFCSVILIWLKVKILWVAYSVTALLLGVSVFIASRRSS